MTSQPKWEPVDSETHDLLHLVATGPPAPPTGDLEWEEFCAALRYVAQGRDGIISPNAVRELVRDVVKPQRVGAFYSRAAAQDLIRPTGEWEISTDAKGKNSGKPCRTYRWCGAR